MGKVSMLSIVTSYFFIIFILIQSHSTRILTKDQSDLSEDSNPFANLDLTIFQSDKFSKNKNTDESQISSHLISLEQPTVVITEKNESQSVYERWSPIFFFENITYILFIFSGLILCLFGISIPKLSLSIFSLYTAHHLILFFCSILDIYDYQNISHQLALFFGTFFLTFTLTITSFFYQHAQYFVISSAITTSICCILLDFVFSVNDDFHKILFAGIYAGCLVIFLVFTIYFPYTCLLIFSSITGTIMTILSFSILSNHLQSFQTFAFIPANSFDHIIYLGISCSVLLFLSVFIQHFITKKKRKILERHKSEKLERTVIS
jgi:hypothetical protein